MRYILSTILLLLLVGGSYAGVGLPSGGVDVTTAMSGSYAAVLLDSASTTISVLGTGTALSQEIRVGNAATIGIQFLCSSDSDSVAIEVRQQKSVLGLNDNLTNNSSGLMYVQPSDLSVAIIDTLTTESYSPVYTVTVNAEGFKRLLFTGLSANGTISATSIVTIVHLKGPR